MTLSKITECYQFQGDNPHPDNYSALDINQPAVGADREAERHLHVISLVYSAKNAGIIRGILGARSDMKSTTYMYFTLPFHLKVIQTDYCQYYYSMVYRIKQDGNIFYSTLTAAGTLGQTVLINLDRDILFFF